VVTDPQMNKHTHKPNPQTGPITIQCAAASAQCNNPQSENDQGHVTYILNLGALYIF